MKTLLLMFAIWSMLSSVGATEQKRKNGWLLWALCWFMAASFLN